MAKQKENSAPADPTLRFERLLDAPVNLVWKMWTEPRHLNKWWGPFNCTSTTNKIDLRAGGEWQLTMINEKGIPGQHLGIFIEIVKHQKIVYEQLTAFRFIATITFEKQGDKTNLTWVMVFESRQYLEQVAKTFGVIDKFKEHNQRLIDYASTLNS